MTKTLTLAALFLVGSVAATASLLHEPKLPAQGMASTNEPAPEARRGSRAPLALDADAEPTVGDQPRRGERGSFDLAGDTMAGHSGDGLRRGNR